MTVSDRRDGAGIVIDEGARRADAGDLEDVCELAVQAVAELTPRRGGSIWSRLEGRRKPLLRSLHDDLEGSVSHLVVGTIDGVIVGYGCVRLVELHDGSHLGRISDIYVTPQARGVGVGEAVMGLLIDWALERGCIGVDSLALPGDRHTKNFFETFGLVARSITVHRSLETADSD